jgi:hypothetical protein
MKFGLPDDDDALTIAFEVSTLNHVNRWIRLRCTIVNTGPASGVKLMTEFLSPPHPSRAGGSGFLSVPPLECGRVRSTCRAAPGISGPARLTISLMRPSI